MTQFSSLRYVPAETRTVLRERFTRHLAVSRQQRATRQESFQLSDESVLMLLLSVSIHQGDEEEFVRERVSSFRELGEDVLDFDELVAKGALRVTWGRVTVNRDDARLLGNRGKDPKDFISKLKWILCERNFSVWGSAAIDSELRPVVLAMTQRPQDLVRLDCPSPAWVAARLWERAPLQRDKLRWWFDRWELLGRPTFVPSRVLGASSAREFFDHISATLRAPDSPLGWEAFRNSIIQQLAVTADERIDVGGRVPNIPDTLLEKALWLERRSIEAFRTRASDDACCVLDFLLREAEDAHHSPAPNPIAKMALEIAFERPELVNFIVHRAMRSPHLLTDLLFSPQWAALAILLVARWSGISGAHDREIQVRDARESRLLAFEDASGVLGHFFLNGAVPAQEVASLMVWMHGQEARRPTRHGDLPFDERMMARLRAELSTKPSQMLAPVVAALTRRLEEHGLGTPLFAAVLELVSLSGLEGAVDAEQLVHSYIRAVRTGEYGLSICFPSPAGSRALAEVGLRSSLKPDFLRPVDIDVELEHDADPDLQKLESLGRSIRAHTRLLSRAIATWESVAPDELVEALLSSVESGALAHLEKGRVAAFSVRLEGQERERGQTVSIAVELGDALRALSDEHRERLVEAALESDEPLFLANLLRAVPESLRSRVQSRLNKLTPRKSGPLMMLTELHARIDMLLAVGAADAAAKFIEVESDYSTLGHVQGRAAARERFKMRLHLLRREFASIRDAQVPDDVQESDRRECAQALEFYKGLAEITDNDGDLNKAELIFSRLRKEGRHVFAYTVNLLAARANKILGGNLFSLLEGSRLISARRALEEADAQREDAMAASAEERIAFEINRALLCLALGRPEQALDGLERIGERGVSERVAAFEAVALSRLGRNRDASDCLEEAEQVFGKTATLRAARMQIDRGMPFDERANSTTVDDPVEPIRRALLELKQMSTVLQTQALHTPKETAFVGFITGEVRAAAASLVSLVPMMKALELHTHEDDITAVMRELLQSRLGLLGWSSADQSRGGFSAKGNAGERDLLIKRDTVVLSVLEAVVCKKPPHWKDVRENLTSHFQKLLGYSTCGLFFHITYAFVDVGAVVNSLKDAAENATPSEFKYLDMEPLLLSDSQPTGFAARYRAPAGEVTIVFLVLDLGQNAQREAARLAGDGASDEQEEA